MIALLSTIWVFLFLSCIYALVRSSWVRRKRLFLIENMYDDWKDIGFDNRYGTYRYWLYSKWWCWNVKYFTQ